VSTSKAIPVESVTLDKTTATLKEGETVTLVATVLPANATNNTGVIWTTSDATIATVADGVVTAVKAGTATISANAGGKSGTCAVTVTEKINQIADITEASKTYTVQGVVGAINTKSFVLTDGTHSVLVYQNAVPTVKVGDYVQVSGTSSSYNGAFQLGGTIKVTALTEGTAPTEAAATPLTAAIADSWAVAKATFSTADIVKYSWKATAVVSGSYTTLNFVGSDTVIEPVYVDSKVYSFVEHKVYNVEAYFTGYSSKNKYASVIVTKAEVEEFAPTTITISAENNATKIVKGATVQLTAAVTAAGAYEKVNWTSSDDTDDAIAAADKVTVDATGLVTAPATAGEHDVTITATSAFTGSTVNATYKLTVVGKSVVIDGLNLLSINEKSKLTYSTTDDSTTATFTAVSSDTTLATIAADGTVTPLKAGEVTITVSSEGYSEATFAITIVSNIAGTHGLANNAAVTTKGVVKGVVAGTGYMLADNFNTDGTANYIYVYDKASTLAVGAYVEIVGKVTTGYGYELVPTTTTVLETTAPTITDTAKSWTNTEFDAWDGLSCSLVTIPYIHLATTTDSKGNKHLNFTVPESSNKGSILSTETIADGLYSITGYSAVISSGYRSFILTGTPTAATTPALTGITITAENSATTIEQGGTVQLAAHQTPFGAESAITWTSSDTADTTIVAANKITVDANGLVTAPATAAIDHEVTITASSSTITGTFKLKVVAKPVRLNYLIDKTFSGIPTAYATPGSATDNDITMAFYNTTLSSNMIMFSGSTSRAKGMVYNTSATIRAISSVVVTFNKTKTDANAPASMTVSSGTAALSTAPTTSDIAPVKGTDGVYTLTYTPTGTTDTFFNICHTSTNTYAQYVDSILVTLVAA
jgi:uncharacterized protein YjdB